ncbi:hypothetical protein SDRG_00260 [Saprolegnia diclina VS20]|uniref:EGF-like domain-containing protein n=1 Tax=Saprolegnia diclina (strain VS20) TaxID=1156394 RepID=T0SI72_SAPDV|nr:hypothetical protein SDRG_00260 [Saprolegnia diclina VS20]EQC42527.1 hypothetical protein SDRG_00260 [Saprolegnia diclina VS20]|eukprot:XP_008603950.1 hypothetical protein SDRG_00260 [Saprolegnia diclina VS20]
MAMCWLLALLATTSAQNAPTQANEFIYGKVRTDGIEYASFDVRPGTAQVVLTFARSDLHGRVPPVLLLKHGGLPTTTDYDVRFNGTSESYWLTQTIPDLRLGRYFIAVWGGALESSIMDFGIGPTINVWYHMVLQFQGCLDTTHLGSECAYFAWPLVAFAPEETSTVVNAAQAASSAMPSASGCFDPNQFIALYALALSPEASFAIDISLSKAPGTPQSFFYALYHDRANPLDASTAAFMSGQGALGRRTYRMNVLSPPEGVWYLLLYLDTPDMTLCSNSRGTKFNVTYTVQGCSASLTTVNDCNTDWIQLDEIIFNPTRSLSVVDRWYMASNPMVNVSVTTSTYGLGYTMQLIPDMAGTNLGFHVIVPAAFPVASLVMLIGIDEYPSEARYAYRLDGARAAVTSGVSSSVSSAFTSQSTLVQDEVAAVHLNGSAVTLSWPPLRFPPIGTWYIAVQTTQSTSWIQGLVIQAQGCSDNMCGDSGYCVAKATYQGLAYSRCVCEYGHAGPFCDQVVIIEEQWHGWFLVITNVAIVPTTVAAIRRHLHVEAVLFGSLGIASSLYHACDLNWFCALPFSTLMSLDFGLSFNSILLCVFHLSGVSSRAKAMAQVVGIVMLIVLLAINPTASINLVFVGCLGAGQLLVAWTGYFVIAAYRTRWRVSFYTIGKLFVFHSDNFNLKMVGLGLILWLGALLCWFFNSSPSYWLLHSLWHLFAMSAAGAFIVAKRADTYRIIDSNGADLLRALPEAKSSMRNVLVAPLPTVQFESLKETSGSSVVVVDP